MQVLVVEQGSMVDLEAEEPTLARRMERVKAVRRWRAIWEALEREDCRWKEDGFFKKYFLVWK